MTTPAIRTTSFVVTGATGGLGRHAVDLLLREGRQVRASGRDRAAGRELAARGASFVPLDLVDASAGQLVQLVSGVEAVWHCAARAEPAAPAHLYEAINVLATRRLLDACAVAGVRRFVYVSSPAVYFEYRHHLDVTEDFIARRPAGAYAASKVRAEKAVRNAAAWYPHIECVILRPRAIFGEHDRILLPRLVEMHRRCNGTLWLPRAGRTLLDLTYAGNVADAMLLASETPGLPNPAIYNITNEQPVTLAQAVSILFGHLGQAHRIRSIPYQLLAAASALSATPSAPRLGCYGAGVLSYDMVLSTSRARSELGYHAGVSLGTAIARTVQGLRHG